MLSHVLLLSQAWFSTKSVCICISTIHFDRSAAVDLFITPSS